MNSADLDKPPAKPAGSKAKAPQPTGGRADAVESIRGTDGISAPENLQPGNNKSTQ